MLHFFSIFMSSTHAEASDFAQSPRAHRSFGLWPQHHNLTQCQQRRDYYD